MAGIATIFFILQTIVTSHHFSKDSIPVPVKDSLVRVLADIDELDQRYRLQLEAVRGRKVIDTTEVKKLYRRMREADSLNLIKVSAIVRQYTWLGPDDIGTEGNSTIFMVIQHADLKTQQELLPMVEAAVKAGKARPNELALLEDRVNVMTKKPQQYASQNLGLRNLMNSNYCLC